MNDILQLESNLPSGLSNPARQALLAAEIKQLEQLTRHSEADLLRLHGMGPKGIEILRQALADRNLSFASER